MSAISVVDCFFFVRRGWFCFCGCGISNGVANKLTYSESHPDAAVFCNHCTDNHHQYRMCWRPWSRCVGILFESKQLPTGGQMQNLVIPV